MCQELCTHIKFVIIPLIEFYRFKLPKNDIMFKKAMNRKRKKKEKEQEGLQAQRQL